MRTIGDVCSEYISMLDKAGISDARLEVFMMLSELTGKSRLMLETDRNSEWVFAEKLSAKFDECIRRRAQKEPAAYILGEQYFFNEKYKCGKGVLIPRPDTEILVEKAIEEVNSKASKTQKVRVFDFCTGTGCIGISVTNALSKAGFKGETYLIDIDDTALSYARDNCGTALTEYAEKLFDVKVIKADILDVDGILKLAGDGDFYTIILSNPPYITEEDMKQLDDDVLLYEPSKALYGGNSEGTKFYVALADIACRILKDGEKILTEHGYDQGLKVRGIFEKAGLKDSVTYKDYGGNDRVTAALKTKG